MSNGAYAGLRLAARAGKPDPDETMEDNTPEDEAEDETEDAKGKKKDDYMTEDEHNAAVAEATAKAKADERARFGAVMASEHYEGREKLAATLLANDKLSADEIIGALEAASPAVAEETEADTEAAAREEMQAALNSSSSATIEANTRSNQTDPKASADVWGKTYSKLGLAKADA